MEINYDWNFNPLESYPTASGETDVVFLVHWQLHATTGSYQAQAVGYERVNYEFGSTFIPFNELTKKVVQTWIESSLGEEKITRIKLNLEDDINNQINPPIKIQQAPWL
jgi:hypothetical protein